MQRKFSMWSIAVIGGSLILASMIVNAQRPEYVWAKGFGGVSGDSGKAIAVDDSGNVYTTGVFQQTVTLQVGSSTQTFVSNGGQDVFLSKQDPDGNFIWVKTFGGVSTENSNAITVDNKGYVYITGGYSGRVDFNPGSGTAIHTATPNSRGTSGTDLFIAKFDAGGNFVWVKVAGAMNPEAGYGIKYSEHSDNLYVTGIFSETVDFGFGGTPAPLSSDIYGTFVLRMKTNGDLIWARALTPSVSGASVMSRGVDVDPAGNVHVTGSFTGTVDFDPSPSSTANISAIGTHYDAFVTKLNASGDYVWAKTMGGNEYDFADDIAVDDSSNVYITGSFQNLGNFDPNGTFWLYAIGAADAFVSKLDKDGNLVWAVNAGSRVDDQGHGIALDSYGNVYTTGGFQSPRSEFNPGPNPEDTFNLVSYGGYDAYIWKLDNDGKFVWAMNMGTRFGPDEGYKIAAKGGYVYSTGIFYQTADFDPAGPNLHQLTSEGERDAFILKLRDCPTMDEDIVQLSGPDSICPGKEYVFRVKASPDALRFRWNLPSGWMGSSDIDSIVVTGRTAGTVSVTIIGPCDSVTKELDVALAMLPVDITVNGMQLGTTNPDEYDSWQWYLNGNQIAGATDSIYFVEDNGLHSVVVSGKNGCVDTAYYEVTNATGIATASVEKEVFVYPNPASDRVYIKSAGPLRVRLVAIDGRLVKEISVVGLGLENFDIGAITPGMYLLEIRDGAGTLIKVEKLAIAP